MIDKLFGWFFCVVDKFYEKSIGFYNLEVYFVRGEMKDWFWFFGINLSKYGEWIVGIKFFFIREFNVIGFLIREVVGFIWKFVWVGCRIYFLKLVFGVLVGVDVFFFCFFVEWV